MTARYLRAVACVAVPLTSIAYGAIATVPVPVGDAATFWAIACDVEPPAFDGYPARTRSVGILPVMDGWSIYYFQEHHGRRLFRVDGSDLIERAVEVVPLLDDDAIAVRGRSVPEAEPSGWNVSIAFEALFLSLWWLFTFHPVAFGRFAPSRDVRRGGPDGTAVVRAAGPGHVAARRGVPCRVNAKCAPVAVRVAASSHRRHRARHARRCRTVRMCSSGVPAAPRPVRRSSTGR